MSTKTLRKRIALVAVAALGFGVVTGVAANAAAVNAAQGTVASYNLKSATANTLTQGAAQVIYVGANVGAEAANGTTTNNLQIRTMAYVSSAPAGGNVGITASTTTGANLNDIDTATTGVTSNVLVSAWANNTAIVAENVVATGSQGFGKFSFTPTQPGTYTITVWNDQDGGADLDPIEVSQTITLTIAASATWSVGGTTVYSAGATANTLSTSTTDLFPYSAVKTLGTKVGSILVNVRDTAGALYTGQVVTASVSGPGFVGGASAALTGAAPTGTQQDTADGTATTTRTASVTDTTGFVAFGVWGDGTAGSTSVTISVTDQITGATTVVATKNFTFYSTVAKLEVASKIYTIGKAGATTGAPDANLGTRNAAGEVTNAGALNALTTTPAFIIKATDSAGRVANTAAAPTLVSSNGNVISGGTCVLDDGADADYSSGGTGYYNCNFDTAAGAASGDKATVTVRIVDPLDATKFISTTIDLTVGGAISKEVISTDKTSYIPGEAMTVTITATDSKGNPVYDGAASPAVTASKALGGTAIAAKTYVGGKRSTTGSTGVKTVYAPASTGSFTLNATGGDAASTPLSASATVADATSTAMAENQAKTDAAIASLIAKINALSKLIAKIQKKLGVK